DKLAEFPSLNDIYVPVHAALENETVLEQQHRIVSNSVDTILCIQVLCSVTDLETVAKIVYRLLQPGGKLIF
ncbi:hypothetical protein SMMN14_03929, partial [Sphaerulina musiva]